MGMVAGLLGGAGLIGASIYQGQLSKQAARRSARATERAQGVAQARMIREERRTSQESRRLNRRQPDIMGILDRERGGSRRGIASTLRSAAGGVNIEGLSLGKTSLLGGA